MDAVIKELAPHGVLRVAINIGNPVLAKKPVDGDDPGGPSVEIARELGRRLAIPLELKVYSTAGKVVEAAETGEWDVGFLAIDAKRATTISFSSAYVVIEGTYLVPEASRFTCCAELDATGVRIAVEENAAYDLFLKRELVHAEIVRANTPGASFDLFRDKGLDALAGVRQGLDRIFKAEAGYRVLPDRFMAIHQAMAVRAGRAVAAQYIERFINQLKASGFVRNALDIHGQSEAVVAE